MPQYDRKEFVIRYGGIYEHSPWVAEETFAVAAGVQNVDDLAAIFANCVERADQEKKLTLIRAHPDLAGRAAIRGELTAESSAEQASAGIDQCTKEEYEQFQALNRTYKDKFGFPFVMAVRDSSREEILAAFSNRLSNDRQTEFETAMNEIHKIARLRLQELLT
ncbi:MAG: 2-oxo-4-hydroxy-4-carboxy-5-ureidoimidazoline decarboxylase [Woeseiaceae bacterium]